MTLDLDTRRRPWRPSDWQDVVDAIVQADDEDENDWIEWKSAVDLGIAEGRFTAARELLGFANRDPGRSAANLEGHALLVIGAEPGTVHGTARLDGAVLQQALEPYLGSDGPAWEHHYVTAASKSVLIICVRPPAAGDPIYTLRKAYNNNEEGAVFIRRGSKIERPSSDEWSMLQRRLLGGQPPTDVTGLIDVGWADEAPLAIHEYELPDEVVRQLAARAPC